MNVELAQRRVVFTGCARDCAPYLPGVLRNLERMASLFGESVFLFVENDSKDATRALLTAWGQGRRHFNLVTLDGLAASEPVRTRRLEVARNAAIQLLRASPALAAFDYVIILDLDDVNTHELPLAPIARAVEFLERENAAAVFANQRGAYYDLWALRHAERCPSDLWEDAFDHAQAHGVSEAVACAAVLQPRVFSLAEDAAPLEVDSAFGGLGIYRMQLVRDNPNPYLGYKVKVVQRQGRNVIVRWQVCEHVHFNRGIRSLGGRLFVLPWLLNARTQSLAEAQAQACKGIDVFRQLSF